MQTRMTTMNVSDNSPNKMGHNTSLLVDDTKPNNGRSLNSYDFTPSVSSALMKRKIKELKLEMPPTRDAINKLFESLNLQLPSVRCIDCILFCRGIKMENSNPDDFDINRLLEWFTTNLRTFSHITTKGVDPQWLELNKLRQED